MSKRIQGFYESFEVFPTACQILRRLHRRWESRWRARRKRLSHEAEVTGVLINALTEVE